MVSVVSVILVVSTLIMGCGGASMPVSYYILNPMDYGAAADPLPAAEALVLGIGPIHLPAYLDRPQIVTRTGANSLKVNDFHRWAAPLPNELTRILSENLGRLTGIQRHETYPWAVHRRPDLAVELVIRAFEGRPDGSVIFDGTTHIHDWRHAAPKNRFRAFHLTQEGIGSDHATMIAAQSKALAELSRQIGDEIMALISK
jgi:hypothetical protein